MKSDLGCAARFIAILFLVLFTGTAKAYAQVNPFVASRPSLTAIPTEPGPAIGEQFTELSAGIFTYSKTDLSLPGPMPINVTRVYRTEDETTYWNNRAFGVGTRLNYDMFLYTDGNYESVSMPDSAELKCSSTGGGQYTCNSQPSGVWFGSVLANDNLTRPDGTIYSFNSTTGLLTNITDRFNNSITISRGAATGSAENTACKSQAGGGSVPPNYVGTVSSSNGRAVYFCYDDPSNPTDITGIADNTTGGAIKKVIYTYGTGSVLNTVTQSSYNSQAVTTYHYNQTYPSGNGDVTTIIVNDACNNSSCGSPNQVLTNITYVSNALGGAALRSISSQLPGNGYKYAYTIPSGWTSAQEVDVTLPDSATRTFIFNADGYVIEDERNVGQSGVNPEYTLFDRGQQTVGTSADFVGEVDEEDQNHTKVRKTNYNYDTNTGNVLGVTLSPAPGQSSCCSTSATWNYTYTTFNRLASAVEPLAYNGVGTTYSYVDGSSPSMTVTDPLGRITTVGYNAQGQPISLTDPIGNPATKVQYYGSGDLKSITDPIGNTTSYTTDSDGRVTQVTSPLQENTYYVYDAIDDVMQVTDPMGNITCNTYDLIGELASTTPPRGVTSSCTNVNALYTTTITRKANLATTTVRDPLGYTTVTDLDGQGRHTDYTDKRGIETTYAYDKFGRVTQALFNSNSISGYAQETVTMSNFDALDRVGQIADSLLGNTDNFTYDSLNSILSTRDTGGNTPSVSYTYDSNGRRTSMAPSWEAAFNYGYDCADELVSMSNNGSSLQSCSPSNYVANGGTSTQVGINYDLDGNPAYSVVDGVQTVVTRDSDERVTAETFQAYPSLYSYGGLTYKYDPDSHMIDKGGSLAAVNMPAAVPTAFYTRTDQVSSWNGVSSQTDHASNLTYDPASGLAMSWTARNQMHSATGSSEHYDGLGRREDSSTGPNILDFDYDGSAMIGWSTTTGSSSYNFMTVPDGGPVAGSFTSGGTTTTWVPLIDGSGSTIALVNAAATGSPPATTYTYDPTGNPTVSGTANSWPFQYQGMEKEFTDPGPLYYSGGGQFYSAQLARSMSESSQTSSQGPGGGPSGNAVAGSSGGPGPGLFSSANYASNAENVGGGAAAGFLGGFLLGGEAGGLGFGPVGALIGGALGAIAGLLEDLFGGGSSAPPTPRQLLHGRHPLYPVILGVSDGLIVDEVPEGLQVCGDPYPSKERPVSKKPQYQKPGSSPQGGLTPEQHDRFVGNLEAFTIGGALAGCGCGFAAGSFVAVVGAGPGCVGGAVIGFGAGVYLGYLGASRGTLPHPQEDLPPPQQGLP